MPLDFFEKGAIITKKVYQRLLMTGCKATAVPSHESFAAKLVRRQSEHDLAEARLATKYSRVRYSGVLFVARIAAPLIKHGF